MTYTPGAVLEGQVDVSRVVRLGGDGARALGPTESYRHAWPERRNGLVDFNLGWAGMRPDSLVFASAGEAVVLGDPVAGKFLGSASFTVRNVVPQVDVVRVRVHIEWDSPLAVIIDYLVVHAV